VIAADFLVQNLETRIHMFSGWLRTAQRDRLSIPKTGLSSPCRRGLFRPASLRYDDRTDGIFPLLLNDEKLSLREALLAYKHQPGVEKRHEQLKTVFEVMPVNLKSPSRIEAVPAESLIEREIRRSMKNEKAVALPLYPEGRPCKAPTANRLFELFEDVRRHCLVTDNGSVQKRFYDDLTELQRNVLRLLGQSPAKYFSAGEKDRAVG
jgi:hypothetical protein